jgi:hypothetical protein
MFKVLTGFLFFLVLVISADTRAGDNLTFTKYNVASQIPVAFYNLGGGDAMVNKTYKDDERNVRTDKSYYTATDSYQSSYKLGDIVQILNPMSGRLGSLFKDTSVNKAAQMGMFDVMMTIATPFKNFDCASSLSFKNYKEGKKEIFLYTFSSFNMVFTSLTIKVEAEEVGLATNIKLSQIAAVKGSTMTKLASYWATGQFEKSMKTNLRKLKSGVGGL